MKTLQVYHQNNFSIKNVVKHNLNNLEKTFADKAMSRCTEVSEQIAENTLPKLTPGHSSSKDVIRQDALSDVVYKL